VTILVTALTIAVLVLTVLVLGLLRSYAAILRHLHDLGAGLDGEIDPGAPAPRVLDHGPTAPGGARTATDIVGTSPTGAALALRIVEADHDTVLAFLSTGCTTCQPFWEAIATPGAIALPPSTRLIVVTQGAEAEVPAEVSRLAPPGVTVVMSSEAWLDHDVPGSPYVALVEAGTGRIRGSGTGANWEQVAQLLQLAEGEAPAPAVRRAAADLRRERELDEVLLAAGIEPGHPSLYLPMEGTGS
jgi:hypothetical protein